MSWTSDNPFLRGPYAPIFDEQDESDLRVDGQIPRALRGVFMRNGPNAQFKPEQYVYPFDGTGMIHAVYLEDGRARYRNRWVLTRELQEERAAGRRIYGPSFGPPPNPNLANTNIIRHAGRYLALFESGAPYEIDRELNTIGIFDYQGRLPGIMSAHPKVDPGTGELVAINYDIAETTTLTYMTADRAGRLQRIFTFKAPWSAMVQDIAITQNYVLAFVCPFVINATKPDAPPAAWEPNRGTAIALLPRCGDAGSVRWLTAPPFFQFHFMNAFEEKGRIETCFPWFSSYSMGERPDSGTRLELHRLTIDLDTGAVKDEALDDRSCEFPRINERLLGRRNRYCYLAFHLSRTGETQRAGIFEAVTRYDISNGARIVHAFPAGHFGGEPLFVPNPGATGEDDGFIFTFVDDAVHDRGSLVILDARDLNDVASVRLARRVPAGLHGSWFEA